MPASIRKTAANMLLNIEKNGAYINIEMNKLRHSGIYDEKDIRLVGEIVNGVIKRKITLDYIISLHSSTKVKKIAPFVLNVLRIGVYQLIFMEKIPPSAAVDECVKIIKKSSVSRLSGYVNAVLRAVNKSDFENLGEADATNLSFKHSFPLWLVERWINEFGIDFCRGLLDSLNKRTNVYVRCNTLVNTIDEFEQKLKDSSVSYKKYQSTVVPSYNYSFEFDNIKDLSLIPGFSDGAFYIQDPAASVAAYLLEVKKGNTVIDLCAAPGGKSLFAADLMQNEGKVISCDIFEHKLKLIEENAKKYKATCITPVMNDASVLRSEWVNTADAVICDVPCSGFGIIRKKPDIKYSRTEADIHELAALSIKILDNAAQYVKNGGVLVFSTCTIEKEENEKIAERFLSTHRGFSPYPFCDGGNVWQHTSYPNTDGTDGFYICRFKKNGVTTN